MVSVRAQNKTIGNFSDYSDYQLSIMRFDAFNDGLDGDSVLNSKYSRCGQSSISFRYADIPTYQIKTLYANLNERILNTTIVMQNMSVPLTTCTYTARSAYDFFQSLN